MLCFLQAQGPNEISVAAHQIVQLIQRTAQPSMDNITSQPSTPSTTSATAVEGGEADGGDSSLPWALVRFVVTGSASSPNAPVDEGFIPTRLLGAPVYPRSSSISAGATSGGRRSMRRWLPSASGTAKERRQMLPGGTGAGKRGSKADMAPPIPIINVGLTS